MVVVRSQALDSALDVGGNMLGTGVTDVAHRVSDHLLARVCFQRPFSV